LISLVAVGAALLTLPVTAASASHRFGEASGWVEATGDARESISVWSKKSTRIDVGDAIAPWNWLAGWELFSQTKSRGKADIVFRAAKGKHTWTECPPAYEQPFHLCIIWVEDTSLPMARHELGHTLGFADHVDASTFAEGRHFAAMVCDEPGHARFSDYNGVMSYCDYESGRGWFGPKDRLMLERAGYLNAQTLDRPTA
jgi:hypothetical protein